MGRLGITYGDIFKKNEEQMSAYNFIHAQKNFYLIHSLLLIKDARI